VKRVMISIVNATYSLLNKYILKEIIELLIIHPRTIRSVVLIWSECAESKINLCFLQ